MLKAVSIPYLRVTHEQPEYVFIRDFGFQSPIYGSRTIQTRIEQEKREAFQSPIYGSRTCFPDVLAEVERRFNPLSTGHAPVAVRVLEHFADGFQSPIYGSRTQAKGWPIRHHYRVSIPYLRVTHSIVFPRSFCG